MKAPESLETLIEYGIIQDVLRPLMSGKEAQVFVVMAGGEECVAKVYKEASQRTFKHRAVYTEGRRTRNTRDQRAMSKRSQHGRKKDEEAWRSTEVDMIYRLRDAGVRVPEPINFVEGVLVMELVKDGEGQPAPRLGDLSYTPEEARTIYHALMREVVRMLCAGVIHGDLSEFNVLMTEDGPVVIDFPQAVDPTQNPNAKKLLLRDVANLDRFLARFAPEDPVASYGEEIWSLFERNRLRPDTKLRGVHEKPKGKVDTTEVMALIEDAGRDNRRRQGDWGDDDELDEPPRAAASSSSEGPAPLRRVVDFSKERGSSSGKRKPASRNRGAKGRGAGPKPSEGRAAAGRRSKVPSAPSGARVPPSGPAAEMRGTEERDPASPARRRRRGGAKPAARSSSEGGGAAARGARSARDEAAPQPPSGPRGARGAAGEAEADAPGRGRNRRRRNSSREASKSPSGGAARTAGGANETAPPKQRGGQGRASSKSAGSSGDGSPEARPARRRRRRAPKSSTTR